MDNQGSETELRLRIDLGADPITGSLTAAHGESRRFSGWIGLAAALGAIRAGVPPVQPGAASCDHRPERPR